MQRNLSAGIWRSRRTCLATCRRTFSQEDFEGGTAGDTGRLRRVLAAQESDESGESSDELREFGARLRSGHLLPGMAVGGKGAGAGAEPQRLASCHDDEHVGAAAEERKEPSQSQGSWKGVGQPWWFVRRLRRRRRTSLGCGPL